MLNFTKSHLKWPLWGKSGAADFLSIFKENRTNGILGALFVGVIIPLIFAIFLGKKKRKQRGVEAAVAGESGYAGRNAAPFCSSSSSSSSTTRWDVFLSFYGKDTRNNFTSHLYSALVRAGISTFMDDPELKKGEEISRGLLNAIHGSKVLIVVLSKNYAFSRWCLDELVEILTSKRTSGHVVIPVFYYVDPSHLRHLKGSFKDALDVHKERYSVDTVEKWASALAEIAGLSGCDLKTDANYK